MKINLPIHTYEHRSRPASSSRLVNCFPEALPPGAKTPVALNRCPGITAWTTVGTGSIEGMLEAHIELVTGQADLLYVVSGSELYQVDSDGTTTLLGDIGTPNRVDMAANTDSLVVVNEPHAYAWKGTYTGTHTAAGNNALVMTDSSRAGSAEFVEDELIGLTISNTTDGSTGVITDNTATTVTVAALAGGSENDWDTSDAYTINTFAQITDDDYTSRGAGDVEFLDNFMLFREPDSGRFFGADLGSVSDFDSLQFAIADSAPDNLVGMKALHRQLITFGTKTGEIWENTGTAGFPFERNLNGTFEEGCHNAKTVAELDNFIYWVADDFTVRRLDGITPVRVSTHAIEKALEAETVRSAFAYDQEGHFFYIIATDAGSYAFDVTTNEWSERETFNKPNWTVRHSARFANKVLVGDGDSNKIGYLNYDDYQEWSTTQRMEWTYQTIYADGQRAFHNRFEIILETGVGATTGQGSDPQIMLQKSDDGGVTWQALPDKSLGALGKRQTRAVWHNLGSARERVYRAAVSDPIAMVVADTVLEVDGGRL